MGHGGGGVMGVEGGGIKGGENQLASACEFSQSILTDSVAAHQTYRLIGRCALLSKDGASKHRVVAVAVGEFNVNLDEGQRSRARGGKVECVDESKINLSICKK